MRRVTVRLADDLSSRLDQAVRERGTTAPMVIRDALLRALDEGPREGGEDVVLERLRRDAEQGGVGAAREYLKHVRWLAEHGADDDHRPDAVDDLLARMAARRKAQARAERN